MNNQTYTGTITALAFGGYGIVRHEGFVVFIPCTAVGDTVCYSIVKKKKNFAFGKLLKVVTPSPERTSPPCPYFSVCGGCQLQHLNYPAQLKAKHQWIEEAIQRQAGLPAFLLSETIPADLQWGYRRRISLSMTCNDRHYQVGYVANDDKTLLPVSQCPIFTTATSDIFTVIQAIGHALISPISNDEAKVSIFKNGEASYLLHFHFKKLPANARDVLAKAFHRHGHIAGILASSPSQSIEFGCLEAEIQIEDLLLKTSPKAFIQNHPEQSIKIYQTICDKASTLLKKNALDLYCGIGISSMLLAKQSFHVTGIELNPKAVELAKTNAANNQVDNVHFISGNVSSLLLHQIKQKSPSLILVNPPREGLAPDVLEILTKLPAPMLIYVSCMPATLARDLKQLCASTYQIDEAIGFDMFPQTTHVETLVVLKSTKEI